MLESGKVNLKSALFTTNYLNTKSGKIAAPNIFIIYYQCHTIVKLCLCYTATATVLKALGSRNIQPTTKVGGLLGFAHLPTTKQPFSQNGSIGLEKCSEESLPSTLSLSISTPLGYSLLRGLCGRNRHGELEFPSQDLIRVVNNIIPCLKSRHSGLLLDFY